MSHKVEVAYDSRHSGYFVYVNGACDTYCKTLRGAKRVARRRLRALSGFGENLRMEIK